MTNTTRTLALIAASIAAAGFIGSASAAEPAASQQVVITGNRIQQDNDAAYQQYKAVVLGHGNSFIAAPVIARTTTGFVPGAYAQYLIRNGESESMALARAARLGEQPAYQVVQTASMQLSDAQLNQKRLGNLPLVPVSTTTVATAQ